MHFRRFAALLLGAWLAGCVFMDMVATQNFRSVDRMLAAPRAQIVLGVVLFLVLLFGSLPNRLMLLLTLLMLGIVLVMHFYLTPEITRLGRTIDFVSPGTPLAERSRFWTFHGVYSACELVKFGLGTVLAVLLVRRRRRGEVATGSVGA